MTAGAMLVAIDITKARNEVLIEAPGHDRRRRLAVPNTRPSTIALSSCSELPAGQ
jgi:hypothetical protein